MWRSDPQIPLASTRTIASSGASSSGSGFSSTRTSPGAWKVTARTREAYERIAARAEKERNDGDRQVKARADHRLFNRDRARDRREAGRGWLDRVRDRPQARLDRGSEGSRLQDAGS